MANEGLRGFLQNLKTKGLSDKEITDQLVKKGVDPKKAAMVTSAYLGGGSDSFSDLIEDIKIQKFTDQELEDIRKSLKGDLYHEESGLKIYGKSQNPQEARPTPSTQMAPPKEVDKPQAFDLGKEALSEIHALKNAVSEKGAKKSALENRFDVLQQEMAQLKEENSRLSSEIKRLNSETDVLKSLMKELINAVKEIRGMLA